MAMQVHHVAQLDRDVAEEVTKWLKYLKGQVTSVQFLTTTVPDPKEADRNGGYSTRLTSPTSSESRPVAEAYGGGWRRQWGACEDVDGAPAGVVGWGVCVGVGGVVGWGVCVGVGGVVGWGVCVGVGGVVSWVPARASAESSGVSV